MKDIVCRAWNPETEQFEFFTLVSSHSILTTLPIPSEGEWDKLKEFELSVGLKDKDGKDIFEGDIISKTFPSPWDYEVPVLDRGLITFGDPWFGSFCFKSSADNTCCIHDLIDITGCIYGEIIGNIHQNPELLREE